MKKLRILDFKKEHLERMAVQTQQVGILDYIKENPDYYDGMVIKDRAFSIEDNDDILFVGGCVKLHPGVGEVWSILSPDAIRRCGRFITRGVIEFLDMLQLKENFHRLFTIVDMEFAPGHRWAKMLGFHMEAIMEQFRSNKKDAALYVRLV